MESMTHKHLDAFKDDELVSFLISLSIFCKFFVIFLIFLFFLLFFIYLFVCSLNVVVKRLNNHLL